VDFSRHLKLSLDSFEVLIESLAISFTAMCHCSPMVFVAVFISIVIPLCVRGRWKCPFICVSLSVTSCCELLDKILVTYFCSSVDVNGGTVSDELN